jgi:hypothetical protein
MGAPPRFATYGPELNGDMISTRGDDQVRKMVLEGTPRMPGFRYTLDATQIDQIIAYAKTLTKR